MRNTNTGLQEFREILADRQLRIDAIAEIGKLGINFDFDPECDGRSDLLARRADLRRAVNALQSSYDRTKPETLTDEKINAVKYLNAEISLISNMLDLAESANGRSASRHNAPELKDSSGRRVGSVLTASMMTSADEIAARLNVARNDGVSLGDFFRGVAGMRTTDGVRAALSVGTDSAGGYTVPTVLLPGILSALVPASSLLSAGSSMAILDGEDAKSFTIAGVDSIPSAAWRNEAGPLAMSDPAFRAISVTPRSLSFMFKVSRELLQDSPNIESALLTAISQAFAKELDRAGLRGSGTAPEIRGLLNTPGINSVTNGANGAVPTDYSNFVTAWQEIVTGNAPAPTAAIMHPRDMASFANLADTTGQPLRRPPLLESMRFLQTSQIPTNLTVGTSTDCSEIYVGDFSQFIYFMREGVSVQLLQELYAATGEIGFACHARVDVAALYPSAFAVITGVRA